MNPSRIVFLLFMLASAVTLAQEGKYVFINGKYVPYRASGRYEIDGETIFYKNERTYDRVPENSNKVATDPYGRPITAPPPGDRRGNSVPSPNSPNPEAAAKMLEAYQNRKGAPKPSAAALPPATAVPTPSGSAPAAVPTMTGPLPPEPAARATGPAVNVVQPPEPQGEKPLAEPTRSY